MKIEIDEIKPYVKKIKIELPTEILNKEIEEAYKNLSKSVNIHGFRKGKVPRKVLEHHYNKSVEADVLQKIIPDIYRGVIKDYNIHPLSHPDVEVIKMEQGQPLSFSITVETLPDIILKDYSNLEFTRAIVRVTDEDVEKGLKEIQEMFAEFESSDTKPVENYDYVILDYEAFSNDLSVKKEANYPVLVGSNTLIPEFEKGLIGLQKGSPTEIRVTFPADYFDKKLGGKDVNFKVIIKEIKKKRLKPADDNFAREVGGYKNIEELKNRIREDMEKKEEITANSKLKGELIKKLIDMNTFELSPSLIEEEVNSMLHNIHQRLTSQGMDADNAAIDIEKAREKYRVIAIRNLKGEILLGKFAEKESLIVNDLELDDEIKAYALSIKENFHVLKRKMQKDGSFERLRKRMLIDKTVDVIIKKSKVSDIYTDRKSEVIK